MKVLLLALTEGKIQLHLAVSLNINVKQEKGGLDCCRMNEGMNEGMNQCNPY